MFYIQSIVGNVIHTVAYSKESRVKAPSRKNIVIDSCNDDITSTEWVADEKKPAMLQVNY